MKSVLVTGKYSGMRIIIDDCDFERVKDQEWLATYSRSRGFTAVVSKHKEYLHRLLLNVTDPNIVVDHINQDVFDNRRCNLRVCTIAENNRNRRVPKNNKSGYKGVYFHQKAKKWEAKIRVGGKKIYLGLFTEKKEAAKAYNHASWMYHGEFGSRNVI